MSALMEQRIRDALRIEALEAECARLRLRNAELEQGLVADTMVIRGRPRPPIAEAI